MDATTLGAAIALAKKNAADPTVIEGAVSDWLDDHPEATTTVEDGSITKAKLDSNLAGAIDDVGDLKTAMGAVENAVSDLESGSLSALGASEGQVPVADGDGSWEWGAGGGGGGLSMWVGTQTEYTALDTYDSNTIYFIKG